MRKRELPRVPSPPPPATLVSRHRRRSRFFSLRAERRDKRGGEGAKGDEESSAAPPREDLSPRELFCSATETFARRAFLSCDFLRVAPMFARRGAAVAIAARFARQFMRDELLRSRITRVCGQALAPTIRGPAFVSRPCPTSTATPTPPLLPPQPLALSLSRTTLRQCSFLLLSTTQQPPTVAQRLLLADYCSSRRGDREIARSFARSLFSADARTRANKRFCHLDLDN